MVTLKKVTKEEVYETIHSYINTKEDSVDTYEDMVNIILSMIKDGYCFIMDRDYMRDAMESLTYMYSPEDDMNRDRLIVQFDDDEEDPDDEDEEDCEDDGLDMLKMMQMMGMAPPQRDLDMNDTEPGPESVNDSAPESVPESVPEPAPESAIESAIESATESAPESDSVHESAPESEIKTCEVTNNKCEEGCDNTCKKVE